MSFIIAIDGPAASGKGTLARRLSGEYGFHHLDTGLTYRAVAKTLLDQGLPLDDIKRAENIASTLDLVKLDASSLSTNEIGNAASIVAVIPGVRQILVKLQREFATTPPGVILDGRDIGTVVCPDANVKIFVTADPETRAKRRYNEALQKGDKQNFEQILKDIKVRDERDGSRKNSPMRQAENALLLDTSKMDIETAFEAAKTMIEAARNI